LSSLPEAFSYSPLSLPGSHHHTIARRDLFDARFQLLLRPTMTHDGRTIITPSGAEQHHHSAAAAAAAAADNSSSTDSDLVPGIYEGGLKTWECALDLAAYLDRDGKKRRGGRVLRFLGCGTAVPTLLFLDHLFAFLASDSLLPSGGGNGEDDDDVPLLHTEIHLQDYNRSVLELVTFPNILLAWYMSPLSAEYRSSTTIDLDLDLDPDSSNSDPDSAVDDGRRRRGPGAITVSEALLSAFTASLEAYRVHLRFFAGSWSTSLHQLLFLPPPPPLAESFESSTPRPYDIVLASETIYRSETLDAFIGLLRAATTMTRNVPGPPSLCLVAAKVLYFGVGGGVEGFVRAVEAEGGVVRTVWEHREGVGRRIMRIEW
ncbi:hypothetical protein BGW80DRAFT_1170132, partial [Lactifluus volemus]